MILRQSKALFILTVAIILLTVVAALGGLLVDGLYRDNQLVNASWFGNDLVTLFVAVPVLTAALLLARRGSLRAQLVWLGMLDYTLYNFAFYLFGSSFNAFFLIYEALFVLSIFALISGVLAVDVEQIGRQLKQMPRISWVSGYMILVGLGLSAVYVAQSVSFVATGQLPPVVTLTEKTTSVVFALDLSLVVPWFILGAVWIWQRRPWGYVIAVVVNVKGAVYMLALSAATVAVIGAGIIDDWAQVALWGFIGVASLAASWHLLGNLAPAQEPRAATSSRT